MLIRTTGTRRQNLKSQNSFNILGKLSRPRLTYRKDRAKAISQKVLAALRMMFDHCSPDERNMYIEIKSDTLGQVTDYTSSPARAALTCLRTAMRQCDLRSLNNFCSRRAWLSVATRKHVDLSK